MFGQIHVLIAVQYRSSNNEASG